MAGTPGKSSSDSIAGRSGDTKSDVGTKPTKSSEPKKAAKKKAAKKTQFGWEFDGPPPLVTLAELSYGRYGILK
jgi:hypothetical protein